MGKLGNIVALVYVLLGLYLINSSFSFVNLPQVITGFDSWIYLISGIFLLLGAYFFNKYNRYA